MTMANRIFRASAAEKAAYKGVYPLHGFVTLGGQLCPVEDLRSGDKDEPQWEVMAPEGFHFYDGDTLHSQLGLTQKDLLERLRSTVLKPCTCEH
jgi:hypothetical protein